MTERELKEHFAGLLNSAGIEIADIGNHIDRAIGLGMEDCWGAWSWSFKSKPYEFAISSSAESYTLPIDFDSIKTIREKTSLRGMRLIFKPKEDFDKLVPRQTSYSTDTPQIFTIFRDAGTNMWEIAFFPQPDSAMTLYMDYLTEAPTDISSFPARATGALMAYIAKHCFPYGTPGRVQAEALAERETEKLKVKDCVDGSRFTVFASSNDNYITTDRPWL